MNDDYLVFLIVGGVVAFILALGLLGWWQERKRREAFRAIAEHLGLQFSHHRDAALMQRLGFLNRLARGSNRYAYNVLQGVYQGNPVLCFDYHYETYSRGSKGQRQTHHHYGSVYMVKHPANFPEVEIYPRNFIHRIGQVLGFQDIQFESVEFSKAFVVKARDRRFAYDVCHPRMMEFLLQYRDFNLEIEAHCIAICYDRRQSPDEVQPHLDALIGIRELMPDYLYVE